MGTIFGAFKRTLMGEVASNTIPPKRVPTGVPKISPIIQSEVIIDWVCSESTAILDPDDSMLFSVVMSVATMPGLETCHFRQYTFFKSRV